MELIFWKIFNFYDHHFNSALAMQHVILLAVDDDNDYNHILQHNQLIT